MVAENLAAEYLQSKGYEILDKNYRKPWGEIDLVAKKEGIMIFVEVKASKKSVSGFEPEMRADKTKMIKVARTSRTYLVSKKYSPDQEWQMDIISIAFDKDRGVAKIKHFKNI